MNELKLIVAGGRDFADYKLLEEVLWDISKCMSEDIGVSLVSGMARGADALAVRFARENNIKLHEFPANWNLGKSAGYKRNTQMAQFADGLLAFWNKSSKGTQHMIQCMERLGKPVRIVHY